jgi:myo-inositol catabolism protein IolS
MRYRNINGTELKVSEICFGTWPISGHGMGQVDEQESIETINKAIELGVNYFDTADFYGFGYAEELLKKVLGSKINEMIIATKANSNEYTTFSKPFY